MLVGCGARTSTLEDEYGGQDAGGDAGLSGGGSDAGHGGAQPVAGAPSGGTSTAGVAGFPIGGSAPVGGAPPVAGAAGAFGGAPTAGATAGGAAGVAGGFAGFGAIGGEAGTGGAIGQLCAVLGSGSCAQCQCNSCAPSIESCFSDVGCAFIFACAQQTGCTGISCYSSATCQPVIDQFGGLGGASIRKVFSLLTCAVSSQSSCGC
ncbi:MAG: hypothetical protein ABW061_07570 [Polyangiaceae bacterium]